jgi:ankyrin repeat protein
LQATLAGDYEQVVQMLLVKGANVNAQDEKYGNALYATFKEGHDQVVQMLLAKGVDVNA